MTGIPLFRERPQGATRERKQSPIKPCHHGTGHPRGGQTRRLPSTHVEAGEVRATPQEPCSLPLSMTQRGGAELARSEGAKKQQQVGRAVSRSPNPQHSEPLVPVLTF